MKQKLQAISGIPAAIPLLIFISLLSSCQLIEIKENERGVLFEQFNGGLNPDIIYQPGVHIFPVWDQTIVYNVDPISRKEKLYVNTLDEVQYEVNLVLKYQLVHHRIGYIENSVGKNYHDLVIMKEVEQAFSGQLGPLDSNSIAALDLKTLQSDILESVSTPILQQHIQMLGLEINQMSSLD